MKKFILISGLTLLLLLAFGSSVQAQSREVTESVITVLYATPKVLPLETDRFFVNYDAIGLTVSDTGQGLFHQATFHALGAFTIEKGKFNDESGQAVWTLLNGDQVFVTYKGTGEMAKPGVVGIARETAIIIGGTGKCTGIKGSMEWTRYVLPTATLEGIMPIYIKQKMTYRLP
jgi:hypothetical protein